MRARLLAGLAASTLLAGSLGPSAPSGQESRLRLAVLPCTNIETTFRKFHPLLTYLKSATGLTVTLVVPADFSEFDASTTNGRVDFALQDPHTFQQLSGLFEEESLLQTLALDGSTIQSGVVVVRRDSGVDDLEQLRGRTVMFGPRTSSPKWIAARLLFESRGIRIDRDLKGVNGGCCEDIAFAVSVKSVDAGVTCEHFLGLHSSRQKDLGLDPGVLKVVGRTPSFPTRIFAARKGLSAGVVTAITRALLQLDPANAEHAEILASAELRGFVSTTEAEYLKDLIGTAPSGRP